MALKDTWKDKVDGVDDVLAKDINSIAQSAIQSEEEIAKQATTIKGKVDKVEKTSGVWVYATDVTGQHMRQGVNYPKATQLPLYDKNGNVKTNAPEEDLDCVNKRTFENGLSKKLDVKDQLAKGKSYVYAVDYDNTQKLFKTSMHGSPGEILMYGHTSTTGKYKQSGTIGVNMPEQPYQAAPRQYVDGKVDPIASDVAILFDALGGAIEYASIDSKDNPVTVPSNVFPAATIDKIGTGIKTDVDSIVSSFIHDFSPTGVTASCNNGLLTINSTEYINENIGFTAKLSKTLSVGDTYYFLAEVVSGSYDISGEGDLFVADGMNAIKVGELLHDAVDYEIDEMSTPIIIHDASVKFNNLVLRISIGEAVSVRGVPVASVKKGTETIYTVPEAIRALKYTDRPDPNDALPVYGLAMSDTVYNYLDLEKKQYVIKCAQNVYGEISVAHATIDVSAYLTDEDGEITVAAGDKITFVDADGDTVGSTVPSTITYIVKKGASE